MVRTQISVDEALYREARREARSRGISFSELVRRALRHEVPPPSGDRPWMRWAGCVASGDPDASASVDAVVYGGDRP